LSGSDFGADRGSLKLLGIEGVISLGYAGQGSEQQENYSDLLHGILEGEVWPDAMLCVRPLVGAVGG
jgi:hypothetical protein